MADEYLDEGRLDKAYILYRRFTTFLKNSTIQIWQACHFQIEPSTIRSKEKLYQKHRSWRLFWNSIHLNINTVKSSGTWKRRHLHKKKEK